ncbi:MAG: 50S ribosomal protein L18 [bacterium]|nr:50S ribosomal protein L18 [bacterium]
MQAQVDRRANRRRVRYRVRKKISGTAARPRLAVFRSLKHIYAQAIDDDSGKTMAQASTLDREVRGKVKHGGGVDAAKEVGKVLAQRLKENGVESAVFDRGGCIYHGRVKAVADATREGGIKL